MFFKNILIFFLFLFSLNLVFANSCLFDFTSDDCKRVVSPYNTFNINIEGNYKLDKFESRLCNKENPSNCLKTENDFDNKKVIQVEPFINPGIYELSVKLYLKGGNFIEKSYEIIYDVSETKIPVIPMKIYTPSSSFNIEGNVGLGGVQIFAVGSSGTKNVLSNNNGNFNISLSGLSSGINYYKFYSQNSLGIKSDIVERIIVSGAKIEENLQRVSSINLASLESLNERTIKSGSNYISSKRNFYVQGTANGPAGARIFVNGQRAIFDGNKFFDFPKSTIFIKELLRMIESKNSIILDFFSGSATTAHAVMQLNAEDQGNRKYIMVQLPEKTDEKSEAYRAGYKNICEIGKERIRRAAKKIQEENKDKDLSNIDFGFRVFKLDDSNMKDVYYNPKKINQSLLQNFKEVVKEDRTSEDLLFQVMLSMGVPISEKVEIKEIENTKVFKVANYLIACFEKDITQETIKKIVELKPLRIVFKESCFKDDSAMINASEYIKNVLFDGDEKNFKNNVKLI
ncbi:hypothetical protein EOM09_04185 [bacterium]|nr:hypothetical protein [bacterium]